MLLELFAVGQLVTFGPEGVERFCVTRYVIDRPVIEFADHEGVWRRSDGDWLLIRNAGTCKGLSLDYSEPHRAPGGLWPDPAPEDGPGEGSGLRDRTRRLQTATT